MAPEPEHDPASESGSPERLSRGEWAGVTVLAFVGAGLTVGSPVLIAAAAIPLAYLFAALLGIEPPGRVQVRRRFSAERNAMIAGSSESVITDGSGSVVSEEDRDGDGEGDSDSDATASSDTTTAPWFGSPGDTVTVRTTVRNTSPETIVDLRVVDGVPEGLPVVSGSHRTCVTLEPGAETTIEYTVELRRGEFEFADPTVRTRDYTGTMARTWDAAVAGDREINCARAVGEVPLDEGRHERAGDVPTDEGGRGIEFHSVREYETGDPISAIDWRRYANTRELATVEYRTERSTRIVCLIDARQSQFRGLSATYPDAIELSLDAAERTFQTLIEAGHPTGVIGLHNSWVTSVPPGTNATTRRRTRELLDMLPNCNANAETTNRKTVSRTENSFQTPDPGGKTSEDRSTSASTPPASSQLYNRTRTDDPIGKLPATLPGDALVYFFSSFVDDEATATVERLRSHGYRVRVVSPDVTTHSTSKGDATDSDSDSDNDNDNDSNSDSGRNKAGDETPTSIRLSSLARETRLSTARATGAVVVDWDLDRPLGLVINEVIGAGTGTGAGMGMGMGMGMGGTR